MAITCHVILRCRWALPKLRGALNSNSLSATAHSIRLGSDWIIFVSKALDSVQCYQNRNKYWLDKASDQWLSGRIDGSTGSTVGFSKTMITYIIIIILILGRVALTDEMGSAFSHWFFWAPFSATDLPSDSMETSRCLFSPLIATPPDSWKTSERFLSSLLDRIPSAHLADLYFLLLSLLRFFVLCNEPK